MGVISRSLQEVRDKIKMVESAQVKLKEKSGKRPAASELDPGSPPNKSGRLDLKMTKGSHIQESFPMQGCNE